MGETTGSAWIGACRDAVVEGIVDVTTDPIRGKACRDTVVGCGVACRDANLRGTVDVTTGLIHGEAFRDANLGGTVGVTTGPVCRVIDTVGVTTGSYLAILRCDATMLVLGGDIVGETTDSLIMSLYSLCRWAIMHCVGSMP